MFTALASLTPDDSAPRAHYLRAAAVMANSQNDVEARESLARESLRVATASDDPDAMALSLAWLSIPLAMSGNLIEAVELAESSLSLARAIASWPSQAVATAALCNILPMAGQSERAIELGEEGVGISEERGELWARGYMLGATSQVHWRQGDRQLAEVQARAGAATKHVIDDRSGLQLLLETLAWMAAEGGVHARAAVVLGSAEHVRKASGLEIPDAQRQQHERSIALALEALGQRTYDESYERGLAMTTEDAVAFAVEDRLPSQAMTVVKPKTEIRLTKRELEIARLIAQEMTSRDIATKLFISERTVEAHVTNMLNKLGLNSRVELARWLASVGRRGARHAGRVIHPVGHYLSPSLKSRVILGHPHDSPGRRRPATPDQALHPQAAARPGRASATAGAPATWGRLQADASSPLRPDSARPRFSPSGSTIQPPTGDRRPGCRSTQAIARPRPSGPT